MTRTPTIYSVQNYKPGGTTLNLGVEGPYILDVERVFVDPYWQPTKSVVAYTMNYTYAGLTDTQKTTQYKMFNLAGLSVWH